MASKAAASTCYVCDKEASNRCKGCTLVFYCSPECQHKDWAKHKQICKEAKTRVNLSRTLSAISVVKGLTKPFTLEFFEHELDMDPLSTEIIEAIQKMYHAHYLKRLQEELREKRQKQLAKQGGQKKGEKEESHAIEGGEKEKTENKDAEQKEDENAISLAEVARLVPPGTKVSVTFVTPLQLKDNGLPKTVRELLAAHGHYQVQLCDAEGKPMEVAVMRKVWKAYKAKNPKIGDASLLVSSTPKEGGKAKKRRNRNKSKGEPKQQKQQIQSKVNGEEALKNQTEERVKVLESANATLRQEVARLQDLLEKQRCEKN